MSSPNNQQQLPDIYTLDQIQKVVESEEFVKDLIDGLEAAFVALEKGDFFAAPIQTLGLPPFPFVDKCDGYAAQVCVKTGYFKGKHCSRHEFVGVDRLCYLLCCCLIDVNMLLPWNILEIG